MKMSTLAMVAGVSMLSWIMIKKMNPEMLDDMKHMMKCSTNKMLNKLEDMK